MLYYKKLAIVYLDECQWWHLTNSKERPILQEQILSKVAVKAQELTYTECNNWGSQSDVVVFKANVIQQLFRSQCIITFLKSNDELVLFI